MPASVYLNGKWYICQCLATLSSEQQLLYIFRNVENLEVILANFITSDNFTQLSIEEEEIALLARRVRYFNIKFYYI